MTDRLWFALVLCSAFAVTAYAEADGTMFPFLVSYDAADNATDISGWLDTPAGNHGFVRVEEGRFVTDAGPIRFWATNFCFEACIPSHEQAERVAARLARFGINCVRMHHMDNRSLWHRGGDRLTIDPERLDRLDYLIFQLKKHGIHTNINLHVSRTLGATEGFPEQGGRPNYDKGVDNFEPRMIQLQKKYARDLLTHVNPYTEHDYASEPAIAMVEINNENALFNQWGRNELDGLTDPYATTFRQLWNTWLAKKYDSTDRLREVWNIDAVELGDELLRNRDFSEPLAGSWSLERDSQTKAQWESLPQGPDGKHCLKIVVERRGNDTWFPQITQSSISLKEDTPYTLTCWLRSDKSTSVGVNCKMAHSPWEQLGLSAMVKIDSEWNMYEFVFMAKQDDENARVTFTGLRPGTYELADISLRVGGMMGVQPGQSLEDNSVPTMKRGQTNFTQVARRDFIDFLWETEQAYWPQFHRFLVDELKVQPPVSGTQLSYSPTWIQAQLDYLDAHAYWQHPRFPGRPWDSRNWYVNNNALVNEPGGTLTSLAARRVRGLPYTISEYNHPTPISYEAEGFPMIAAFAAFQGWDGVFTFAYSHNTDFEPKSLRNYFDIKANAVKLVHHPACAAMFLRGDVAAANETVVTPMTKQDERDSLYASGDPWQLARDRFGTDPNMALVHRVELDLVESSDRSSSSREHITDASKTFTSDTEQLHWDASSENAGYFTVSTPRTKLFTGFARDRWFTMGTVSLRVESTREDWATISLVCLDGAGFDQPGRVLIAATGMMENSDAEQDHLEDGRVTLQRGWGSEPLLCEGISAQLLLPIAANKVTLYPLDAAGNRKASIAVGAKEGKAVLSLSPTHKTLWYEAVLR